MWGEGERKLGEICFERGSGAVERCGEIEAEEENEGMKGGNMQMIRYYLIVCSLIRQGLPIQRE